MDQTKEEGIKQSRFALYFGIVTFLGAMTIVVLVFFWSIYPKTVIEIKKVPVPSLKKEVLVGDYITLIYNYCKHIEAEGTVKSSLVSKTTVIDLPDSIDTTHKGCHLELQVPMPIPKQAATDMYHFHYIYESCPNPIRCITSEWDTQEFHVTNTIFEEVK